MSHEIENEMIAYANEVPWHGIGAQTDPAAPMETWLENAKLNWTIERQPLFLADGRKVPNRSAFVRSSDARIMTVANPDWKPVQNAELLGFMDRYCRAGGAKMEVAGGLRDGQVVWALAKINYSFEVRPGDKVLAYLLLTGSHVAGRATSIKKTSVRVVCRNTMNLSESGNRSMELYNQNHRNPFDVDRAKEAVEAAIEEFAAAERRAKTLDKLKLTAEDAVRKVIVPVFLPEVQTDDELIREIMRADVMPKKVTAILHSIEQAPGAIPDTGWGVLNGITHYCDHVAGRNAGTRMWNSWMGENATRKQEAEKILMDLAA
jgi:phage/plasmid-like protein (TIGR03299 family)